MRAKEEGKLDELRQQYLKLAVKWFTEKHSCLEIKQEKADNPSDINNKGNNQTPIQDSDNRSNNE